jgi:hypothetical protein
VPLAIDSHAIRADEHHEQVIVKLGSASRGQAAGACEPGRVRVSDFEMGLAIGAQVIGTGQHLAQVVAELVRGVNREPARAVKLAHHSFSPSSRMVKTGQTK